MEKYVLGFFQEQLSKIIIGFRREQVNANLLNGKGEITDVQLNCSILNKTVSQLVPFATFEEVHVTRLGFHVTSWANLRKAPIVVDIGCITAVVEEPLNCLSSSKRNLIRMMTEKELARLIEEGLLKAFRKTGSYGIVDRITDNLTIEVQKFHLSFRSLGKFKTKRVGPWTPPTLIVECTNIRSVAVDLHGHEGTPDQIWAHNHRRNQAFLHCRKLSMETSIEIASSTEPERTASLMKKAKMEFQVAIRQRLRDGQILAVQSDMTIPSVDLTIEQKDLPLLASLLAGIQYCVSKDRSFDDPLKAASTGAAADQQESPSLVKSSSGAESTVSWKNVESGELAEDGSEVDEAGTSAVALADSLSVGSSSSAEDAETDAAETDAADVQQSRQNLASSSQQTDNFPQEKPVLVLPLGIVIHDNVCITTSVHQVFLKGVYKGEQDSHVQVSVRGSIAELIWPKSPLEFGFYLQSSVAYCSIAEKFHGKGKTLLINGMAREDHTSLEKPSKKPHEINVDENFPLFERRSIRDDPLDVRHSFPSQGLGQKVTVEFLDSDNPKFIHEVGVDEVELTLDAESWWRVARFGLNEAGGGYDPRIHSGDWSDILAVEMLQNPSSPLNLDDHVQDMKELFLDENYMISSDLFNATLRFSNITMYIPAAVKESIRACAVVVELTEATVTVTSALPRTFLSGKIGNSISGDGVREKGIVDFPNDPSDIAYELEREGDPLMVKGGAISKKVSTFRQQVTVRGFQVRIIPVIPFCNAPDPQTLIAPVDLTLIACFEGETPPLGSKQTDLVVFLSVQVHRIQMNIDFDLLAGMTSTLLLHGDTLNEVQKYVLATFSPTMKPNRDEASGKIKKNLQGRRVMVRRHVSHSRESGGLAIVFCLQQAEFGITLWRQNLPVKSPLLSVKADETGTSDSTTHITAMKLLDISMGDFELGFEFGFKDKETSRTVVKCCLDKCAVKVCSFCKVADASVVINNEALPQDDHYMVDILTFGVQNLPDKLGASQGQDQQFALRFEEQMKGSKAWSMSADLTSPALVNLHIDELKECITLFIEALLLPTWSKREVTVSADSPFPDSTVGAYFYSLVASKLTLSQLDGIDIDFTAGNEFSDPLVERVMNTLFEAVLPTNVKLLLFRLEVANLLVQVPINEERKSSIGVLLNKSDFCTRFCRDLSVESNEIENVLACKGVPWSNLMKAKGIGFYQSCLSRSSLVSITGMDAGADVNFLIHPCSVEVTYINAKLDVAMSENLQISDIRLIEAVIKGVVQVGERAKDHALDILSIIAAMKKDTSCTVVRNDEGGKQAIRFLNQKDGSPTLGYSRFLMKQLHKDMSVYEESIREVLSAKDSEVYDLKKQLFAKEQERFSAVALLSSRVAGWIRMGGLHLTGQRVTRKTTMWPYWAILRKDLLLLFSSPGELRPKDAVLLVGAKIRELSRGSSIKRGFALIENSGTTRYFIAANGPDYVYWTNEISTAMVACNGSIDFGDGDDQTEGTQDYGHGEFEDQSVGDGDVDGDGSAGLRERIRLGNRLTGAKNRLGSAIQTARQKGKEMSDRARTSSADFDGSSKGSLGSTDLFESVGNEDGRREYSSSGGDAASDGNSANGKRRLSSRLGYALQTARQRVRDTPEKQGSFAGLKNKIVARSPSAVRIHNGREDHDSSAHGRLPFSENGSNEMGSAPPELIESRTWTCQDCTFINSSKSLSKQHGACDMCGVERRSADDVTSNGATADIPFSSDTLSGSRHGTLPPVAEARDSALSSIESSDDTFRRNGFSGLGPGSPKIDISMRQSAGRFNFLRRTSDTSATSVSGVDAVTMKDIHASKKSPSFNLIEQPLKPLKIFEGRWLVRVKSKPPGYDGISKQPEYQLKGDEVSDESLPDGASFDPESTRSPGEPIGLAGEMNIADGDIEFQIQVLQVDKAFTESSSEKLCRLGDIFELYVQVSESIERISSQLLRGNGGTSKNNDLPSDNTNHLVEKVMVGGMMLGGILDLEPSSNILKKTHSYQAEVIEAFFNSLLGCPLPVETLATLTEVLGICASTKNMISEVQSPTLEQNKAEGTQAALEIDANGEAGSHNPQNVEKSDDNSHVQDGSGTTDTSRLFPGKLFGLLSTCETELLRFENRLPTSSKMETKVPAPTIPEPPRAPKFLYANFDKPLLPASVQEQLNQSIYEALFSVMAERDEAHAQLVGSNVYHVHEVEQEKRKIKLLQFELEVAKQGSQSNQAANVVNLFGQKFDVGMKADDKPQKDLEAKLKQFQRENNDDMMTALSRQLAVEIHSKTECEAEIKRIKKSEELKAENGANESKALKEELKRVQELLKAEQQVKEDAVKDSEKWKAAYESLKNATNSSYA